MLIISETTKSKAISFKTFSLSSATVTTVKSFLTIATMGAIGFIGYYLFASPMAPWAAAVESMIVK